MKKPKNYNQIDYAAFKEAHREQLLRSAVEAIDPDAMGMNRDQALTLAGAMKTCGFTASDFDAVMSRSGANKGTFVKQWEKFSGSGEDGDCTEGTIFKYAQLCGWKWPRPEADAKQVQLKPKENLPELLKTWNDDFKIICIMDNCNYDHKPEKNEIWQIREREAIEAPLPEPMAVKDFARAVASGCTFHPTVFRKEPYIDKDGKTKYKYRAISQQLFIVDIDNDKQVINEDGTRQKVCIDNPLTIPKAFEICEQHGINPFFCYETFSSKEHRDDPEKPYFKFRLCFATDKPITVQEYGQKGIAKVIDYFVNLFGEAADHSTTDPARLIFGTDEKDRAHLYRCIIDSEKLMQRIYEPVEKSEELPEEISITPTEDVDAFLDISLTDSFRPVPTGWTDIDRALKGGFVRGQEVFVSAAPGMGKTTLCQQIAESFARHGHSVIYYNLEMSKEQMIARSISRRCDIKLSALDVMQGYNLTPEQFEEVRNAAELYKYQVGDKLQYNPGYYNQESGKYEDCEAVLDNILESMKQNAEKATKDEKEAPIFFIDYLHLLRSEEDAAEMIKQAVQAFHDIATKYKTIVFVISANNRTANKSGKASIDSGRDTSAIEYSGDILLSMNYKLSDSSDAEETAESINYKIRALKDEGKEVPYEYKLYSLRITKSRYTEPYKRVILEFDGERSRFNQVELSSQTSRSGKAVKDPEAPNKAIQQARARRKLKRADYINAYNAIYEASGEVSISAMADYLGVKQATVKTNIKDLCSGMFAFNGEKQTVEDYKVEILPEADGFQDIEELVIE